MVSATRTHSHTHARAFRQSLSFASAWCDINTALDHIHHTGMHRAVLGVCMWWREGPDHRITSARIPLHQAHLLFANASLLSQWSSLFFSFLLLSFALPLLFSTCQMWFSSEPLALFPFRPTWLCSISLSSFSFLASFLWSCFSCFLVTYLWLCQTCQTLFLLVPQFWNKLPPGLFSSCIVF